MTQLLEKDRIPRTVRFSRITVPSRDPAASQRFFVDVLGGKPGTVGGLSCVNFGSVDLAFGNQRTGATEPQREYPHYAFTVRAPYFAAVKRRLEAFGVPTHEPWTRVGETHTLMYFREPCGNQFELFCPEGDTGLPLRIGANAGGDYRVPFASLVYDRLREAATGAPPLGTPLKFDHMTLPAKELSAVRRLFTGIFGGVVNVDLPVHVTVNAGGFDIGYAAPQDGGWPDPSAAYPRYAFTAAPEELAPLRERLAAFGLAIVGGTPEKGGPAFSFRDPAGHLWDVFD